MSPAVPAIVWQKKTWKLKDGNPFPAVGVARLGGEDNRENGQLFDPEVQRDKIAEATEKFVLGAAYGSYKFGFLWSLGTGLQGDARGFGKSSLLQYLTEAVNKDFGAELIQSVGLDESDAVEHPICALIASFDMYNARNLNAVFFAATVFASKFRRGGGPTLVERVHARLVDRLGTDDLDAVVAAAEAEQDRLLGRTLGPPQTELLRNLARGDTPALVHYLEHEVSPTKQSRSGGLFLATLLLFIKAAGINHVLVCCDQLEDFASTSTPKNKRRDEIERFRDYLLEIQPMCDVLSCVVTMHPRAVPAINEMWTLADLPRYEHDREENRNRVVVLEPLRTHNKVVRLLRSYLDPSRSAPAAHPLHPFTDEAIDAILTRSDGKPRDILRLAHELVQTGATENWDEIDGAAAARVLDTISFDDDLDLPTPGTATAGMFVDR